MDRFNQSIYELTGGRWSMQNAETILPLYVEQLRCGPSGATSLPEFSANKVSILGSSFSPQESDKNRYVAVLPIIGTITKYATYFGYGTKIIANEIIKAAQNDDICGIVLQIDSGGGNTKAVPIIKEAIEIFKATKKPIIAHCSNCGSAAYWIASQCDLVFADSEMSVFGSIGMICEFIDFNGSFEKLGAKVHTVYADESPDKNLSYRNALDGDYKLLKEEMSPLVQIFHADVIAGRKKKLNTSAEGVLTGAAFLATDAISFGLTDAIVSFNETIERIITIYKLNN